MPPSRDESAGGGAAEDPGLEVRREDGELDVLCEGVGLAVFAVGVGLAVLAVGVGLAVSLEPLVSADDGVAAAAIATMLKSSNPAERVAA